MLAIISLSLFIIIGIKTQILCKIWLLPTSPLSSHSILPATLSFQCAKCFMYFPASVPLHMLIPWPAFLFHPPFALLCLLKSCPSLRSQIKPAILGNSFLTLMHHSLQ